MRQHLLKHILPLPYSLPRSLFLKNYLPHSLSITLSPSEIPRVDLIQSPPGVMLVFQSSELPIPVGNVAQSQWESLYSCQCVRGSLSMCTTKCAFFFVFFVLVGFCIYGPLRAFFWSSICTSVSVCVCIRPHACLRRPSQFPSQCYLQGVCCANTHLY